MWLDIRTLGFEGVGHDVAPHNAMDSREGNNFRTCSQTYAPELGYEGIGQGVAPNNAMDPKEGNNLRACNFERRSSTSTGAINISWT